MTTSSRQAHLLLIFGVVAAFGSSASISTQPADSDCTGTLDGSRFPFLVPEYVTWEVLFRSSQNRDIGGASDVARELQLSDDADRGLKSEGGAALTRASAVRQTGAAPQGASVESIAADAILESRDDLLRRIAALDRDKVLERIEMLRHKTLYTFAKRGRRTSAGSAEITCLISINGREHPELIPEAYYWEFHLRALAAVSSHHRTGPTTFDVDYFSTLRKDLLQIPAADVVALLNHAVATIELIDQVRNSPLTSGQTGEQREAAAARVSAVSRLDLMSRLSKPSWMAIDRHARSRRGGITYDFPTGF